MIFIWNKPLAVTVRQVIDDLRLEVVARGLLREVRDVGKDLMLTCPFHKQGRESSPSMGISKEEIKRGAKIYEAGTVHCYTCNYTADLPKFVADVLDLSSRVEGLNWLIRRYTYGAGVSRPDLCLDLTRGRIERQRGITEEEVKRFIRNNDKAINYMRSRGIGQAICELFEIGYNAERDSVTMPIRDLAGHTVLLKERSLQGKRYFNTEGSNKAGVIYGLHYANREDVDKWWVVESEIDALTLWERGQVGIALSGSSISQAQIGELVKTTQRTLVDALDRDSAGRRGGRELKDKLIPLGFRIYNLRWKNTTAKDINELTSEEFAQLDLY